MKKNYILCFCAFILLINILVYIRFVQYPQRQQVVIARELGTISEPLSADSTVELPLEGNGDMLVSFSVFFSTYGRKNMGEISLEILNQGKIITQNTVDMQNLEDNAWYDFSGLDVRLEKGEAYQVKLTSTPIKGGISVWFDNDGVLVSSYWQTHQITPFEWLFVNITYSVVCLIILGIHFWLRKEG